jgi:hypothetical protein
MANFFKTIFALILIAMAGFGIWKLSGWKHVKTDADLEKEYLITCQRMSKIANALDEDYDVMPEIPKAKSIQELKEHIERYAPNCPLKDTWGNYFIFSAAADGNFFVASAGSDGIFDGFDQEGKYSKCEGQDIISERGKWKLVPESFKY